MATFIEPKFPVASKPRRVGANTKNHTLEDVAEEVLNGMFCHYEPPDPEHRTKPKTKPYRSILRRRSGSARQQRSSPLSSRTARLNRRRRRRVRWVDEIEATKANDELSPSATSTDSGNVGDPQQHSSGGVVLSPLESTDDHLSHNGGCGVVQVCFDAGREVGCYSSRAENNGIAPVPKMNAQQAMAVARSKSPRHAMKNNNPSSTLPDLIDIVFDDEGNPRYAVPPDVSHPPPPITPPVPPPNKKEIFFPELCGVRINCMDDDMVLESTTSSSLSLNENSRGPTPNHVYHRRSDKDTDDAENSIIFDDDDEDDESETSGEEELEEEVHNQTSHSRYKAAPMPVSQPQPKKSMRQVIQDYKDVDDEKGVDWENASAVSSTFFRRVWSRNKDNSLKTKSLDTIKESKPILTKPTGSMSKNTRHKQSSRSSSPSNDFDPVEMNRSESQTKVTPSFGGLLAIRSRNPSRPTTIVENSDWDDNIPIVQSGSGEDAAPPESAPSLQPITKQTSPARGEKSTFLNRRRSRSLERQSKNETMRRSMSPSRRKGVVGLSSLEQHGVVQNSRSMDSAKQQSLPESAEFQLHPAHPLVNPKTDRRLDKDDVLERRSNITAHRRGFEDAQTNVKSAAHLHDDALERQSMITAHRNGFEDKGRPSIGRGATEMRSDFHQSPLVDSNDNGNNSRMIRGHKANIKAPLQQKAPVPRVLKHSPGGVSQMSHDDMLERMSFITASHRGMEVPTVESSPQRPWTGPAMYNGPTKNRHVGKPSRDRSPFRRSSSYEQDHEPINTYQPVAAPYNFVANGAMLPENNVARQFMMDRRNSIYPDAQHFPYNPNPAAQSNRGNTISPHESDRPQDVNERSRQSFPAVAPFNSYVTSQYHPVYGLPAQPIPPGGQTMQHPMGIGQIPVMYHHPMVGNNALGVTGGPIPPTQQWMGQDYFTAYNDAASVTEQQPNPVTDISTKAELDLTWEERTRQAWERLRGGMAALAFDAPKGEIGAENAVDASTVQPQSKSAESQSSLPQAHPPLSPGPTADMYNLIQSPSHPRENFHPQLNQPPSDSRRVSFGAPQTMMYYDNQDENQTLMSYPSYPGQTKKKKKFRGTKLVSGVYDKMKNSLGKVSLSLSSSSDSNAFPIRRNSSQPSEWEIGRMYPSDQILSSPSLPIGYSNVPQTMYTNPNVTFTPAGPFQHQPQHHNHIMDNGLQQQLNMNNSLQQQQKSSLQQQHIMSNILQQQRNNENNLEQRTTMDSVRSGQGLKVSNPNGYQYDPRENYGQSV